MLIRFMSFALVSTLLEKRFFRNHGFVCDTKLIVLIGLSVPWFQNQL